MLTVTLYTREDCQLCQLVEEDLAELRAKYPHRLVRIDVDKEQLADYIEKIPVLEIGPYCIQAPIDKKKLAMTLGAASDRQEQLENIQQKDQQLRVERSRKVNFADRLFFWLSRRYMVVFNAFILIYLGMAFLAPVLMASGRTAPAKAIYTVYSRLCHQLAYRSWFLFGEQAVYPREIADVQGLQSYEQATGLDTFDMEAAFRFVGNQELGYKTALCQRDVAIYSGILLFGVIFSVTGRKIPSLPLVAWFVLGIMPIGLDGISQIISQLPWDIVPMRESTPLLRTITGALFGFSTAWFGYPVVEESMVETRKVLTVKMRAVQVESLE